MIQARSESPLREGDAICERVSAFRVNKLETTCLGLRHDVRSLKSQKRSPLTLPEASVKNPIARIHLRSELVIRKTVFFIAGLACLIPWFDVDRPQRVQAYPNAQLTATPTATATSFYDLNCPPHPDDPGQADSNRCYAVRRELFNSPRVVQVNFKFDAAVKPCLPLGLHMVGGVATSHHSLGAIWLNSDSSQQGGGTTRQWVEFGATSRTFSDDVCENINTPSQFYSYCGNCYSKAISQPSYASNGYMFHGEATNNASVWMAYEVNVPSLGNSSNMVNRWTWSLNGNIIRVAENPSIHASDIVRIGGETTSPRLSNGRYVFSEIVRWTIASGQPPGTQATKDWWRANDKTSTERLSPSERGRWQGGRYFIYVKYHGESAGKQYNNGWRFPPLAEVFSDQDISGVPSECDYIGCSQQTTTPTPGTPTMEPLPTSTPTP